MFFLLAFCLHWRCWLTETLILRMKRKRMLVVLLENVNSILFDAFRAFITEELKKKKEKKRSGDGECDEL